MGGSLNSVGKDPAALTAGRCRLASGVAAPSTCRRGIPAGAARRIGGLGEVPTPHRRRSGQHRAARVSETHEGLRGFSEPRRPDCLRRALRDSQDSFNFSPLAGSQAAVFATLGGSLSRCSIRACGMLAGVTSVSAQNPCGGCEHPACPNVLVPTLSALVRGLWRLQ